MFLRITSQFSSKVYIYATPLRIPISMEASFYPKWAFGLQVHLCIEMPLPGEWGIFPRGLNTEHRAY